MKLTKALEKIAGTRGVSVWMWLLHLHLHQQYQSIQMDMIPAFCSLALTKLATVDQHPALTRAEFISSF